MKHLYFETFLPGRHYIWKISNNIWNISETPKTVYLAFKTFTGCWQIYSRYIIKLHCISTVTCRIVKILKITFNRSRTYTPSKQKQTGGPCFELPSPYMDLHLTCNVNWFNWLSYGTEMAWEQNFGLKSLTKINILSGYRMYKNLF
jgi:hypothetical protein